MTYTFVCLLLCRGWACVKNVSGQAPAARWNHSLTTAGRQVVVYGGRDATTVFGQTLHLLHHEGADVWRWSELKTEGVSPLPFVFSHTCTASDESNLFIYGGLEDLTSR